MFYFVKTQPPAAGRATADVTMGRMKQDRLAAQDRQRHATTLGELQRQGIDIFCWCNRCGHSAVAPVGVFVAQLGPSFTVPDIGAHLRCSGCDNKDIAARPAWPSLGQVTRHHDRRAAEETSKPDPPDPPDRPGGRTPVAASSDGGQ